MYKTTTQTISFLSFLFVFTTTLSSQTLWPGDLNNNGIVNGVDHLYWAVANQTVGPVRPGAVTDWEEQDLGNLWADQFPESTNYAYADVNGDGQVNANDADAISINFLRNHGNLIPDNMEGEVLPDGNPEMTFYDYSSEAVSNETSKVNLGIAAPGDGLDAFYGVTMTINYPPNILQVDDGMFFGADSGTFFNPGNADIRVFVDNNSAAGTAFITIVRTNQENVSGQGGIGRIILNFVDLSLPGTPTELRFEVTDIVAIDIDMNPIGFSDTSFSFNNPAGGGGACPNIVSPVCGSDGVTYLNSCYAEAAGIYDYTEGSCFDDSCIDADMINLNADCTEVYEPVCGCNDVTYSNQCAADAAGVVSTTPGLCQTSSCYDPLYVVTSEATSLNPETGVITVNCPTAYDPVCGCNGVTYANACMAEANGITVYTQGSCESSCVDPTQMVPDAMCDTNYDPVCGCNGVTYTNSCRADAAGVVSYTSGPCNGNSSWCEEAIPVQCGDFLPYETSIGTGNDINLYPSCSGTTFLGPDRVYVIQKESAGDLQIGLEILTPGLDLDLFLLSGNCNQVTCVGKSTTSNSQTNNEGIVLEDAPIGTYYIVVDGQYADSEGNFRLEVSCGYLHCGDAVPLQCGQTYYGNNMYGNDDVSLYSCDGNVLNVENNGPEIVHTFTTTEDGPVNISLSGLSANLELFLLRSCDRGDCIEYSQNSGTNSEYLTEYLPAGTYYIVVDGFNGGVSDYSLLVDCSSDCDLAFTDLSATSSGCGQSSGVIHITSSGGTPNYLITYTGPLSGSFTTSSNSCTISYLPPGTYTITKTDSQGCSISGTVTILGGGSLSASMTPNEAVCMTRGSIDVWISNGQAPYTAYVNGPTSGTVYSGSDDFTIGNLAAGDYTIHITDANGCSISQNITIEYSSGDFIWNYEVTPANCGAYGAIHVDTYNGDAPYNILLSGPLSGGATVYANSFNIVDLPGGTYQLTIEDDNWCQYTRTVVVPDGNLNVEAISTAGACGQNGSVLVTMTSGIPNYTVSWTGPENGSITTSNGSYVIPDLASGSYNITVVDSGGCTDHQTVTVTNGENDQLHVNVIPLPGSCSQNGALWIDIYNGSPIYTISYTGPLSGTLTTSADGLDIPNLPCGTYYLTVTDYNGCSSSQVVVLGGCEVIGLDLTPQNGICGHPGSILATINGGSPTYVVSWSGPSNGQTTTNTNSVNIPNLIAGTYNVQVTDANGCTDYAVTQVSSAESNLVLNTNTSEASCNTEGTIGLTIGGGIGLYQISWTGPENGNTSSNSNFVNLTGLPAGAYHIYVTDGNGCSASTQAEILNVASDLGLSLVGNDGICSAFGNIGVFITNGNGPYQIYWNGPTAGSATSASAVYQIPNTPPGIYNVVVTDANGCSASGVVVINNANTLSAYLQVTPANCGQDGTINVFINQGSPIYTISWTGPESGNATTGANFYSIPNLMAGDYTIVVTDANGCSNTLNGTINDTHSDLTIIPSLIYNICGQYNTIWVDIIGGTGPYTVIWEGTVNGSGSTNTQGFEIMDLPPGTYKVIVIDANGCMVMQPGIIIYPTPVDLFDAQAYDGICGYDGSININITGGTDPYTLSWNGPLSGTQNYATAGNYSLTNLPGGTYVLTLTDINGCTETETVVVNTSSPIEIIAALIYNECGQYNTIWVDIVGGTGPYTVSWEGTVNGSGTTNTTGFEIMDLPPGTYKVIVVDANGCMVMQQGIIIYEAPIDIFSAYASPGICGDNGNIHVNVTGGTGPYLLQYTGPQSGVISAVFGEQVIPDVPTGTYNLTLTDTNGCIEVETVTVINSGSSLDINTSLIYNECGQYNTIWVDIVGGTGPYTVSWQGGSNGSGVTNTQGFEIEDLPPGTYKVTVVDANGCMVMQQGIIVYPAPVNLFTATPINGLCGGAGSILVNVLNGTAPYHLIWTGPSNGNTNFNGNNYTIPNLLSGTYTLSLTDTNGCTEVEVVIVTATESDVDLTVYGSNASCAGGGSITAQGVGGDGTYTLSWTGPESGVANIGNSPFQVTDLSPGTYLLNLNDGNGCDDTESYTVSGQEDELIVSLTPTHGDCSGDGQLAVNITGGTANYTVGWSGPSSGSVDIAGQFVVIPNLPAGSYTVTVVSSEGCTDVATSYINNTGGAIYLTATPIPGFCGQLGYVFLNITGGSAPYQVNWTGGSTPGTLTTNSPNVQIPDVAAGTYTITVISGNCSGSTVTTLSAPAPDLEITTSATNATCGDGGSINVNISNATGPVTLNWTGPDSGSQVVFGNSYTIPNLSIGTYTVTASSGSCSAIDQVSVGNDNSNVDVYATPTHAVCDEAGSINVTFNGAAAPYFVSWTGPTNGSTTVNGNSYQIADAVLGTYYITVSSGNCSGSATTTVYQAANDLSISAVPQNGSCLTTPGFVISVTGGTGPYQVYYQGPISGYVSVGSDPYTLSDIPAGQYYFTVTDGNGCSSSTIGNVLGDDFAIDLNSQNGNCGDDAAITVTINNGTGPYQISWYGVVDGFATTNADSYTINNLPGGLYIITVQDANGCSDEADISVESGPTDFAVVYSVSNNGCGALNNIWMDFYNGEGPYTIEWIGPNSGSDVTTHDYYDIQNASSGIYTIIITDANGCVNVQWVEVINILNDLQVTFTPVDGSCGSTASIQVDVQGGEPWYTIAWNLGSQPIGETDFNSDSYTINNLDGGTYYVRVTDENGCQQTANVTVSTPANVLQVSTSIVGPGCTALGSIGLVMNGGQAPYSLNWSGVANGSDIATDDHYLIGGLNGGNYQVNITDANGCSNTLYLEVPGTTIGNLSVDFDYTVDGLTVHFQNMSSNGSYFWQFGDSNSTFENHPTHTYNAPGTYEVCVSVSGSCGSDQHCEFITVESNSIVALLDIGEGSGGANATISLPVTIHNADNLISLAGTIEVMNEDVATIVSATNGIIAPQFNAITGTFSYFNNTGDYLNINEGDVLFYVNVVLIGNVGESTILKFAQNPLPIEVGAVIESVPTVIPYTLSTGMASIEHMAALNGRIETYWGDGIEEAEVTIVGPGVDETMVTNETGNYNMPSLNPGMEYSVSAYKDIAPENGLSTYALFIGQRFLLGYNPSQITSPYQVIAGDANCNDAFTTLDLFLIQRLIIGAAASFDNCPSWVFVADDNDMPTDFNAYNVFPYSNTNTMMLMEPETANFVGVKIGDILGQANPNNFGGGDDRTTGVLPFQAANVAVNAGDEVSLYFSSNSFEQIVSYQFGLQFPSNMVEFMEFTPSEASPFETVVVGDANAAEGRLRLSWFSLDGQGHSADANTPLFVLKFRALTDIDDWNTILRLDPGEMLPEAYNAEDESLDPELAFGDATTSTIDPADKPFALYQNVPNPVTDVTSIGFYLPQGGNTDIMIHDAFGQLIWSQNKNYGAGEQRLKLDDLQLPAGVYYYSLRAGKDQATRSMIVVE